MGKEVALSIGLAVVVVVVVLVAASFSSVTGNVASIEGVTYGGYRCVDTDGHLGFTESTYTKGAVTRTLSSTDLGDLNPRIKEDFCTTDNKERIIEFSCNSQAKVYQTKRDCPNGCLDGACIE